MVGQVSMMTKDDNVQGYLNYVSIMSESRNVIFYFPKTTATYVTASYKVSFNSLVSDVGGGIGLFLGFSLLSTLTSLSARFLENKVKS